jgi:hypothetical protein
MKPFIPEKILKLHAVTYKKNKLLAGMGITAAVLIFFPK